jgi:glycosyltransferase involved in cell wall biosynthesis
MKTVICHEDHSLFLDNFINFLESDLSPERDLPIVLLYCSEEKLPPSFIYYNTEQLSSKTNSIKINSIIQLIKKHNVKEVWDYSKVNIDLFKQHSITAKYVPLQTPKWYSNKLLEFRKRGIEYDVGFCGTPSPKREFILKQLEEKGLKVNRINGLFGDKKDEELAKCKILINIHWEDDCTTFESGRCDAWLSIGVPIVSENSLDNDIRCINVEYHQLVSKVVEIVELEKKKMSICLVMIVKNEEDIIRRSLSSVLPFVDTWCIVDTGSTDSTIIKIKEIVEEHGKKGFLHQRPWKNFGYNRSEALELARPLADWSMMFDADDIFKGFEGKKRENRQILSTTVDAYSLTIKRGNMTWNRRAIFNNTLKWHYVGVVHEYAHCLDLKNQQIVLLEDLYIDARTEGSRSKDINKYKHDAELLEKDLEENPRNERSMFYAAQSWRDYGNKEKALYWYGRRADTIAGWHQERYISLYNMVKLTDSLELKFQYAWRALSVCPKRLEATYEVLRYTRSKDLWSLQAYALGYISNKEATRKVDPGFLFFDNSVHDYAFDDEFAIHCYYLRKYEECAEFAFRALQNAPPEQLERIKRNYEVSILLKK